MNIKVIGFLGALFLFAPIGAAVAAPASGLTAHAYSDLATAPQAESNAAVLGDTAKVEKIWWRRGWGWRRPYWGWGWRRPYWGWGWRRPYWGWRRPYWGWRRPYWRRRWYY